MFSSITATGPSPARSVVLNRSFTDDGCDQPAAASHQGSLHISSSSFHETITEEVSDEPTLSDILGCNNIRTICRVKADKEHYIEGHGSRNCTMSSQSSVDPGSCPESANDSVSTHSTTSQSAHRSGWTTETQLARSQERRRRLECRYQRERSKRRSMEQDRDEVLKFVKGLLLGLEDEQENSTKRENSLKTISSIREFVSQQEMHSQSQSDQSSSNEEDDDDVHTFFTSKQYPQQEQEGDSARKLRMLFELPSTHDLSRPQSPTEYSDDSSYDTCEAKDEFEELPVKFRSVEELRYDGEKDDGTEDTYIMSFSSSSDTNTQQADELQRYKDELESLKAKFDQATQSHLEEIDSMKRLFQDESRKREDLLERAVAYAEQLEDIDRNKSSDLSSKQKDLEALAHQHFQKIEALRREHHEELRDQKEKCLIESTAQHAKELKNVKKLFEEELAKQLKEKNIRHAKEIKALKARHEKDTDDLAKIHENLMQAIKEEQMSADDQRMKLRNLENSKLLQTLQDRDATIEKLRAEITRKNEDIQNVKKTLSAHRSIVVSLEKQRKVKGKELQKARDVAVVAELATSTDKILELQEDVRERDTRISELEDIALKSKQKSDMNAKLQEQLQERIFEIATLRNEHSQATKLLEGRLADQEKQHSREMTNLQQSIQGGYDTLEMQRLKKETEGSKDCRIQAMEEALRKKDFVLDNLEARYSKKVRKVQNVLEETKEMHTREVAALVIKLDEAKDKHASEVAMLTSRLNTFRVNSLTKPVSPNSRSSYHRSRIEQEYEVNVAKKSKGKKKPVVSTWFTKAQNGDLDSTSPTVATSCSDLFADDEGSISTFESRNSLSPRANEKWKIGADNSKESIVTPVRSFDSGRTKQAPRNKLPPSLLNLVGGLVKTPP